MSLDAFDVYLKEINTAYQKGDATEHTHRPALKILLESLSKHITATNDPKRIACGAPDYSISRKEGRLYKTIGYVETKDIGSDLKKIAKDDQIKRYLGSLHSLIVTDYLDFRWYVSGELRMTVVLAKEGKGGKFIADDNSKTQVQELLGQFLQQEAAPIKDAKELAGRMAGLARLLHDVIVLTFKQEDKGGALHGQFEAFKKVLLHDLKEDEFADMYAQTIAYGLFTSRCYHKNGDFSRKEAVYDLPKTNPFLRQTFGHIAGAELDERVAWLVDDLASLLRDTQMDAILRDFGKKTKREDPVVHFYETFLAAYDPKLRESRGVYYTPEPVVSYIVRSVDWILREKFGLKQGLADKSKVKIKSGKGKESSISEMHRCLILDPACGTGTFLYEVIRQIREQLGSQKGAWSQYVKEHLLPRVFGFELMMAPYAVCHMKLGLELAESGYDFSSDERLGVYLTNTLEEAEDISGLLGFGQFLSDEAKAANVVKRDLPIMVVLGNPPYSYESSNNGEWISKLVRDYYFFDSKPLGERNPKGLQDDYVKFLRYGQYRIQQTGAGVLAFITNHGYIDNPTFRGMRQQLMQTFSEIYILDLHGNAKKKETCPDGSEDKNVFDIQQGVSIGIFIKEAGRTGEAKVYHMDLWGKRDPKYNWLNSNNINSTEWRKVKRDKKNYILKDTSDSFLSEYNNFIPINEIMHHNQVGIYTARDNFTIGWNEDEFKDKLKIFISIEAEEARNLFNIGADSSDWAISKAQKDLEVNEGIESIQKITYRPFDIKYTSYTGTTGGFLCRPRYEIMKHLLNNENKALCFIRRSRENVVSNFFIGNYLIDKTILSSADNANVAPLYLYPTEKKQDLFGDDNGGGEWAEGKDGRIPNLSKEFVDALAERVGLGFVSDGRGDLKKTFGPEDVFDWVYGVFHSPQYRQRYAEFLKIDFPRVPMPKDRQKFAYVCAIGRQLAGLHLMEAEILDDKKRWPVFGKTGTGEVGTGYPKHIAEADKPNKGRVYINEQQYFEGIELATWEFTIGGYQVCEKWLKDRRGRTLSFDDIQYYQKIVVALRETIRLMADERLRIFE